MRHRLPADVLLLVTVLFWSFNFTVVKYALTHGWEPLAYSSIRFAVGAVIFSAKELVAGCFELAIAAS